MINSLLNKTLHVFISLAVALAVGVAASAMAAAASSGPEAEVNVSPKTVNIQKLGDDYEVRVFTSMPYVDVLEASTFINGEFIPSSKSTDSWGRLVMKFYVSEIKPLPGLLLDDYNFVRIAGIAAGPEFPTVFWGEDLMYLVDYRLID